MAGTVDIAQMIYYTKYFNLKLPYNLEKFLESYKCFI